MLLGTLCTIVASLACTVAAPYQQIPLFANESPRPLVIWHGLGDTSTSSGMAEFKKDLEDMYPGIFVMNVKVPGEGSIDDERKAGFVSEQAKGYGTGRDGMLTRDGFLVG
jgi:hypothetical protein